MVPVRSFSAGAVSDPRRSREEVQGGGAGDDGSPRHAGVTGTSRSVPGLGHVGAFDSRSSWRLIQLTPGRDPGVVLASSWRRPGDSGPCV